MGKRYTERYTSRNAKHFPSQMICGKISMPVTSIVHFLPPKTTMNGSRYLNLLRDKLKFHMQFHRCPILIQDRSLCHTSKAVRDFLKAEQIQVIDWPINCSDSSPIENL